MRRVSFHSVLHGVARLLGMDPARDLSGPWAIRLTAYINRALIKGWRFEQWPEWTITEQRQFRPSYAAGQFITAGDEMYFAATRTYYQALQDQTSATQAPALQDPVSLSWTENSAWWAQSEPRYRASDWAPGTQFTVGNDGSGLPWQCRNPLDGQFYQCISAHTSGPAFDPTKWAVLKSFAKYVADDQDGATPIWETPTICAFKRDPRVFVHNPFPIRTTRNDIGLVFDGNAPPLVWIKFWPPPPQFTVSAWNANTAYDQDQLAYYNGETYRSLIGNNTGQTPGTSAWALVAFPLVLSEYCTRMALADALREQKQTDRAMAEQANAELALQDEADKAIAGQGLTETATVETAPSPHVE